MVKATRRERPDAPRERASVVRECVYECTLPGEPQSSMRRVTLTRFDCAPKLRLTDGWHCVLTSCREIPDNLIGPEQLGPA